MVTWLTWLTWSTRCSLDVFHQNADASCRPKKGRLLDDDMCVTQFPTANDLRRKKCGGEKGLYEDRTVPGSVDDLTDGHARGLLRYSLASAEVLSSSVNLHRMAESQSKNGTRVTLAWLHGFSHSRGPGMIPASRHGLVPNILRALKMQIIWVPGRLVYHGDGILRTVHNSIRSTRHDGATLFS